MAVPEAWFNLLLILHQQPKHFLFSLCCCIRFLLRVRTLHTPAYIVSNKSPMKRRCCPSTARNIWHPNDSLLVNNNATPLHSQQCHTISSNVLFAMNIYKHSSELFQSAFMWIDSNGSFCVRMYGHRFGETTLQHCFYKWLLVTVSLRFITPHCIFTTIHETYPLLFRSCQMLLLPLSL